MYLQCICFQAQHCPTVIRMQQPLWIWAFIEIPEHPYPALTSYLQNISWSLNVREEIHFHSQIQICSSRNNLTQTNKPCQRECAHNKEISHMIIEDEQHFSGFWGSGAIKGYGSSLLQPEAEWVRDKCHDPFEQNFIEFFCVWVVAFYWWTATIKYSSYFVIKLNGH